MRILILLLSLCLLGGCQMTATTTWNGELNNTYTTVMMPSLGGGAPAITILEVNGKTAGVWAGATLLAEVAGAVGEATAGYSYGLGQTSVSATANGGNVRPGRPGRPRPHLSPRND